MKRYVDINEISDGRFYGLNDMVKADCADCTGCSACCRGMGNSIVLDPLDVHRLSAGLKRRTEELLSDCLELNVVDGIILPNLKMAGGEEACVFLNEQGRCRIHGFRPGICRIFPLGRFYEDGSFQYFLQVHECRKENRSKVKVWKWIDTPDAKQYDAYISDWHYYISGLQKRLEQGASDEEAKQINLGVLTRFYLAPYDPDRDFYEQFYERLESARK